MDEARARGLLAQARALLGPGIGVGHCLIGRADNALLAEEKPAMARATGARRAEFAAGRQAARAAMAALGLEAAAIPMGSDRAPVWPAGLSGSITHTGRNGRGLALAAVAAAPPLGGLGLDLEEDTPLQADLWPTILGAQERAWLASQAQALQALLAKRMFSAKEATYKAQYIRSRTMLDFHDISVTYTGVSGIFTARFHREVPGYGRATTLQGRQICAAGMILSAMRI